MSKENAPKLKNICDMSMVERTSVEDPKTQALRQDCTVRQFYHYHIVKLGINGYHLKYYSGMDSGNAHRLLNRPKTQAGSANYLLAFCKAFNIPYSELGKIKTKAIPMPKEEFKVSRKSMPSNKVLAPIHNDGGGDYALPAGTVV